MTSGDLIVLVPWVIFGVAIAVICYMLFVRRRGPRRVRRARRRRLPQLPPDGERGEIRQAPPQDQEEEPGHARPSRRPRPYRRRLHRRPPRPLSHPGRGQCPGPRAHRGRAAEDCLPRVGLSDPRPGASPGQLVRRRAAPAAPWPTTRRAPRSSPTGGTLLLDPGPHHDPRWLNLNITAGQPAVRIDLNPLPGRRRTRGRSARRQTSAASTLPADPWRVPTRQARVPCRHGAPDRADVRNCGSRPVARERSARWYPAARAASSRWSAQPSGAAWAQSGQAEVSAVW